MCINRLEIDRDLFPRLADSHIYTDATDPESCSVCVEVRSQLEFHRAN